MSKYMTTSLMKSLESLVHVKIPKLSRSCLLQNERVAYSKFNNETSEDDRSKSTTHLKLFSICSSSATTSTTTTVLNPIENNCGPGSQRHEREQDNYFVAKHEKENISAWQAGFNVTNAIQGMSMVSLPYTVLEGGYMALMSMIVVAQVCCYTGDILIDCLYEEKRDAEASVRQDQTPRKRIRGSYVSIAEDVWGKKIGGRIVYLAQLIELIMTCTLYVLLCGELLSGMFPNTELLLTHWIAFSTLPLLPCVVLRNMKDVAWLSFWCTVSHAVSNGIVFIYCLVMVEDWRPDLIRFRVDLRTLPISLGIVVFSYTSQVFLPSIEGSMNNKQGFKKMMFWSHLAAAIFKVTFAFFGFATFGLQTQEVVTNNLPGHTLKVVVNVFLVSKALLSFPLPYFATIELLETTFFPRSASKMLSSSPGSSFKTWEYLLRISLICLMPMLAAFIPHFAILLALIGSFTGNMLSLVWPAYFHYVLRKHSLSVIRKALDVLIIMLGLFCSIIGIFFNAKALHNAFRGLETKPFEGYL